MQMQDVIERDEEEALMRQYTRQTKESSGSRGRHGSAKGFVVVDAPWSSSEDFPSLGGSGAMGGTGGKKAQWGPSSRGPNLPRM